MPIKRKQFKNRKELCNNFAEEAKVVERQKKPDCINPNLQNSWKQNKQITQSEIKEEKELKYENDKQNDGKSFSFSSPENSFGEDNLPENSKDQLLKINKTSPALLTEMTRDLEVIKIKSKKNKVLYEEDLMDVWVNRFNLLF